MKKVLMVGLLLASFNVHAVTDFKSTVGVESKGNKEQYDKNMNNSKRDTYKIHYKLFKGADVKPEKISISSVNGEAVSVSKQVKYENKGKSNIGLSLVSMLNDKNGIVSLKTNLDWLDFIKDDKNTGKSVNNVVVNKKQRIELGKEFVVFEAKDKKVVAVVVKGKN